MPHHAKNSDYIAAADPAMERMERRELLARFATFAPDAGPVDELPPCTNPFDPQEHVRRNRAENPS